MHKKKAGIAFVGMGAVLILSALLLFLYNEGQNAKMEQAYQGVYAELNRLIAQQKTEREAENQSPLTSSEVPSEADPSAVPETEPAMTIATLDGQNYIGILEIPALELALPILADWDDEKLDIAPCRHFGSAASDDLVIAGHNYRRHFLYLYKLAAGDGIRFTDMTGTVHQYTVAEKRTLDATAVDTVLESEYDLILYTCTYSGKERTAVFCSRDSAE